MAIRQSHCFVHVRRGGIGSFGCRVRIVEVWLQVENGDVGVAILAQMESTSCRLADFPVIVGLDAYVDSPKTPAPTIIIGDDLF
jgi:hypothetical protein